MLPIVARLLTVTTVFLNYQIAAGANADTERNVYAVRAQNALTAFLNKKRLRLSKFWGVTPATQYSLNLTAKHRSVKRTKGLELRARGPKTPLISRLGLLDFYCRTRIRKLLPDGFGFFFRNAFLHCLGSGLDQIFRFLQPQSRNFANDFDDRDLVSARGLKNDVEF